MIGENRYGSTTTTTKSPLNKPHSPAPARTPTSLPMSKPPAALDGTSTPIFPIAHPSLQYTEPFNDDFSIVPDTQYSSYSTHSSHHTSHYSSVQLAALCILSIVAGVGNNISFVQMGLHMPLYPAFLLIATTLLYVLIFSVWLTVQSSSTAQRQHSHTPKHSQHNNLFAQEKTSSIYIHYTAIALLIVLGGIFSQYSNVFVGGSIQSLSNQLTLPVVTLMLRFMYKHKYTSVEKLGICIVFVGSIVGVVLPPFDRSIALKPAARHDPLYANQFDSAFWVGLFTLSDIPSALTNVYEDYIFTQRPTPVNEIHYLCWSNVISLVGYVLAIPCMLIPKIGNLSTFTDLYENQRDALVCVFASAPTTLPEGCSHNSYVPIVCFVVCVVVYFYCLAVLIKQHNPIYQVIVQACITPVSAIAFSSTWIQGKHAEPLSHYTVLACVLVPIGIAIYKWNDVLRASTQYEGVWDEAEYMSGGNSTTHSSSEGSRQYDSDSEMLPLIARH